MSALIQARLRAVGSSGKAESQDGEASTGSQACHGGVNVGVAGLPLCGTQPSSRANPEKSGSLCTRKETGKC